MKKEDKQKIADLEKAIENLTDLVSSCEFNFNKLLNEFDSLNVEVQVLKDKINRMGDKRSGK